MTASWNASAERKVSYKSLRRVNKNCGKNGSQEVGDLQRKCRTGSGDISHMSIPSFSKLGKSASYLLSKRSPNCGVASETARRKQIKIQVTRT